MSGVTRSWALPVAACLAVAGPLWAQDTAAAGGQQSVHAVGWLSGCWARHQSNVVIEEHWMAPRGGSMVGMSRTVRADSLVGFELVVIREAGPGLRYEASPSGQRTATFVAIEVSDRSVVFENREHDFPQQIGYGRVGPDSIVAFIAGPRDGGWRRVDFPYGRAPCPASIP